VQFVGPPNGPESGKSQEYELSRKAVITAHNTLVQGIIKKKCDRTYHKPDSNGRDRNEHKRTRVMPGLGIAPPTARGAPPPRDTPSAQPARPAQTR
jgi:hypothetical protein